MLRDYMQTAQDDLQTKEEICNIKQQRLQLAQDEVNVLFVTYFCSQYTIHDTHRFL